MKIVYKGSVPEEVPFHLMCSRCSTVVELKESEMVTKDPRDGSFIECPVCGSSHLIYDTQTNRSNAVNKMRLENTKAKLEKEAKERIHEVERERAIHENRSGGATGPLNPPDLPH